MPQERRLKAELELQTADEQAAAPSAGSRGPMARPSDEGSQKSPWIHDLCGRPDRVWLRECGGVRGGGVDPIL